MSARTYSSSRKHLLLIGAILIGILLNLAPVIIAGLDLAAAGSTGTITLHPGG